MVVLGLLVGIVADRVIALRFVMRRTHTLDPYRDVAEKGSKPSTVTASVEDEGVLKVTSWEPSTRGQSRVR